MLIIDYWLVGSCLISASACVLTISPHININMVEREREMVAERKRKAGTPICHMYHSFC
jgi:hypothetical protein